MRKAEREALEEVNFGLSLPQCRVHNKPLVCHIDDFGEKCWDCPAEECGFHIHDPRQYTVENIMKSIERHQSKESTNA